jgi:hypothetical protein
MDLYFISLFVFSSFLWGCIPAAIAYYKGRSFFGWWLFGVVLFIIALPLAIVEKPDDEELEARLYNRGMKKCPYCAEMIKGDAEICKYCGQNSPDEDEMLSKRVDCPSCGEEIILTTSERLKGKFICDACKKTIDMTADLASIRAGE